MAVANQTTPQRHSIKVALNSKLSGVKPEIRQIHGRDHYVVPTVMMVEGVHNGSSGPGYYPSDVMRKVDIAWNSKPIVLGHPKTPNGEPLLAASADVLNEFQVGILCNTCTGEDCRQVSEAWLEKSLLEAKAPELAAAVANGEVVEVSTGYFLEADMTQGVWNSQSYSWKAISLQPDHFAILTGGAVGACSVEKGAGLCRNEAGASADEVTVNSEKTAALKIPSGISIRQIREAVEAEIESRYPNNPQTGDYTYVAEIFPEHVIFRTNGELFSIPWSLDAGGAVSLTGLATPVKREVHYTPIGNSSMTKEQLVAAIIAANKGFDATKSAELLSLNEATLAAIHASVTAKAPVVNDMAGLASAVSPELLSTLNAAVDLRNKARSAKIAAILASGVATNQAELELTTDSILDGMATLAAKAAQPAQTQNQQPAQTQNQQPAQTQNQQPAQTQLFGTFGMPAGSAPLATFNAGVSTGPALPQGFAMTLPSYLKTPA